MFIIFVINKHFLYFYLFFADFSVYFTSTGKNKRRKVLFINLKILANSIFNIAYILYSFYFLYILYILIFFLLYYLHK